MKNIRILIQSDVVEIRKRILKIPETCGFTPYHTAVADLPLPYSIFKLIKIPV